MLIVIKLMTSSCIWSEIGGRKLSYYNVISYALYYNCVVWDEASKLYLAQEHFWWPGKYWLLRLALDLCDLF